MITEWLSPSVVVRAVLSLQTVGATFVFFSLGRYNQKHLKRFAEAQKLASKSRCGVFDPSFFRGDTAGSLNPFENTTWRITGYERAKISILAVIIFPIRALGVACVFLWTYLIVAGLLYVGLKKLAKMAVSIGCRMVLFCFGFLWIEVKGVQDDRIGALVSNHCSFLDGFFFMSLSTPRVFAEKSNFNNPILRTFGNALEVVLFERGGQESRQNARKVMADAATAATKGHAPPILVFPEGTTKHLRSIITFKDGAFGPGLPVQPVVLRYKFQHCDPTWAFAGPGGLMLAFKLLCQFVNRVELEFLPVCIPGDEEKHDSHKFARNVQRRVAEALGVPWTTHSVEDVQFQFAAVKAKLPPEAAVVEFAELKSEFGVDAKDIKNQLRVFKEMDPSGTGLVDFDEFKQCFSRGFHEPSQAQTRLLQEFFKELTGGKPNLDFRAFLVGLALSNEQQQSDKNEPQKETASATTPVDKEKFVDMYRSRFHAQLAFAAFAAGSDDRITWQEFRELWQWIYPDGATPGASKATGSAREVFDSIAGRACPGARADSDEAAGEDLTFDMFSGYADRNPGFEKRLRQAFFARLATVLSPG